MNFIPLNVSLDEACFSDFIRRYHFDEKDKPNILRLYRQVMPRVHAAFHYVVLNERQMGKCGCDSAGERRAAVVVTLGQAFDDFQESFLQKGNIHSAYILDCIGLEILWAAYDEVDKKLFELTGLYAGEYSFPGDFSAPLSRVSEMMGILGQKQVTFNEAYALTPKKSVVFEVPLLKEKTKKNARCASCCNDKCEMRYA